MKIAVAIATLALAASVSAQSIGPVDPAKLPTGWCSMYTGTCEESTIITECGANSTFTASCHSTFSLDKVCTSFTVSCVCTPLAGGEKKDISAKALNETVSEMPGMCDNLSFTKNATAPGVVSGDYLPDGKKPKTTANVTAGVTPPKTTGGATNPTPTPGGGKSAASTLQMALPTVALVAITMGLAMIPLGPIHANEFRQSINRTRLKEIEQANALRYESQKSSSLTEPYPTFTDDPETLPSDGQRRPRARVIDIIPVNDDMDMLEVRMEELDSVVDLFVIVESEFTFTLQPKPLYFRKNKDRFKKFAHKTLVLFIHEMSWESRERILQDKLYDISWAPEVHERSLGMRVALKESQARTGDWIIYSELDEIPRKEVIAALHGVDSDQEEDRSYRSGPKKSLEVLPQGKDLFRLNCAFYEYSFEYQFEKQKWNGPVVFRYFKQNSTVYDDFISLSQPPSPALPADQDQQQQELVSSPETPSPQPTAPAPARIRPTAAEVFENFKDKDIAYYENWVRAANRTEAEIKMYKDTMKGLWIDGGFKTRWLRDNVDFPVLKEACWHCTYCQANINQILNKLRSSSHREYNQPWITDKAWILDHKRTGKDLINRPGHELKYIADNYDVPDVVNRDRERYKYILAAHGTRNAGYHDVHRNTPL
ncbi:hypothetical protein BGZ96_009150 [Linnemannia gamsii]|uniref:Glycosyltransferase family 17 protein n=1 Tax=Linnemannia gamsii TaxID=64522 RepID=A0ABQ7JWW4_9FUNG|nr:hypothetical protein BGZ96_009150 [Linnemannia gamsii]